MTRAVRWGVRADRRFCCGFVFPESFERMVEKGSMGGRERAGFVRTLRRRRPTSLLSSDFGARFRSLIAPFSRCIGTQRSRCDVRALSMHSRRGDRGRMEENAKESFLRDSLYFFFLISSERKKERAKLHSLEFSSPPPPAAAPCGALPSPPRRPQATYRGQASGTEGESHCEVLEKWRREEKKGGREKARKRKSCEAEALAIERALSLSPSCSASLFRDLHPPPAQPRIPPARTLVKHRPTRSPT